MAEHQSNLRLDVGYEPGNVAATNDFAVDFVLGAVAVSAEVEAVG